MLIEERLYDFDRRLSVILRGGAARRSLRRQIAPFSGELNSTRNLTFAAFCCRLDNLGRFCYRICA